MMEEEYERRQLELARHAESEGAWYYDPDSPTIWKQYIIGPVPLWKRIFWGCFPPSHITMQLILQRRSEQGSSLFRVGSGCQRVRRCNIGPWNSRHPQVATVETLPGPRLTAAGVIGQPLQGSGRHRLSHGDVEASRCTILASRSRHISLSGCG